MNNKLLWKNIKQKTYTNKTNKLNQELAQISTTPVDSAKYTNQYFTSIGNDLA